MQKGSQFSLLLFFFFKNEYIGFMRNWGVGLIKCDIYTRGCRICNIEDSMLWARPIQWDWTVHSTFKLVPKPRAVRVLGSIPSVGESQQNHSPTDPTWQHTIHAPHEPLHHHGPRFHFHLTPSNPHPHHHYIYTQLYLYIYMYVCLPNLLMI